MKKWVAIVLLLVLIGVVAYIYQQKASNPEVEIERLKLKYGISVHSDPETLLKFSEELGKLSVPEEQKHKLNFERKYWKALALNKSVEKYIKAKKGLFSIDCAHDTTFVEKKLEAKNARELLLLAKKEFESVKGQYGPDKQNEWQNKLIALENSVEINYSLLYLICPEQ